MKTDIHFSSRLAYFFLEWEMFQTKFVEKIKNTHFYLVFFYLNRAVYEIMWKNTVQPGRPHNITRRMRSACWVTSPTNTGT
jgi:hypothetical protein